MANFKQNNNAGGRQMYKAVCSECGKDCEVPFKPTGEKPVFCSDCFKNKRGGEQRRFSGGDKKMYKAICDKCGKECEVPFKPTGDKPVYCNQCFGKGGKDKGAGQAGSQFETINAKLDEILRALGSATPAKADKKGKAAKKVKVSKPKKKSVSKVKKAAPPKKAKPKAKKKK